VDGRVFVVQNSTVVTRELVYRPNLVVLRWILEGLLASM
jgi:hypothetical protein